MAEFKRLSDVEVVAEPTESANVLIEENGVIKKAPKTAVGGAEPDLVIRFNDHLESATIDNISIVSGSVEAVYDAFESGKFPVVEVEVVVLPTEQPFLHTAQKIPAKVIFYGNLLFVTFAGCISIYGHMVFSCKIVFDSTNNYALTNFDRMTMQIAD